MTMTISYTDLFNKTFHNTVFSDIDCVNNSSNQYSNFQRFESTSNKSNTSMVFEIHQYNESSSASINFTNVKSINEIDDLFPAFNFQHIVDIVNCFFTVGEKMSFFKSLEFPSKLTLADFFVQVSKKFSEDYCVSSHYAGKVHFKESVMQKSSTSKKLTKTSNITLNIKFRIINDEVHPIVILTLPFTYLKKEMYFIDLYDTASLKPISEYKKEFDLIFLKFCDMFLRKHFKLKNKDLNKMSIEEKLAYFPLIEMLIL